MIVDSYRFLPRSFIPMYSDTTPAPGDDHPVWAPFDKRLAEARIAVLTSAGLYLEGEQPPFDGKREKAEPTWGDPTHRVLPAPLDGRALGMMHLHVNPEDVLADPEIALPLGASPYWPTRAGSAPWRRATSPSWGTSRPGSRSGVGRRRPPSSGGCGTRRRTG